MFSKHGFHPLEFLTILDPVYRYMAEASGQLESAFLDYYRATAARFKVRRPIYCTWVVADRPACPSTQTDLRDGATTG